MNKQIYQKPVITSITFYDKDSYVNFSDTDAQVDYFHGCRLGINSLLDHFWADDLGEVIKVHFINNEEQPKFYKRLERLRKAANYKLITTLHKGISRIGENSKECFVHPYFYRDFILYDPELITEREIIERGLTR